MTVRLVGEVRSNYQGFERLIVLHEKLRAAPGHQHALDLARCSWMDANMCAVLGVLLSIHSPPVTIGAVRPRLEEILQKNRFFQHMGFARPSRRDTYRTTIEFRRFERTAIRDFMAYLTEQFKGKGLPEMTPALRRKFRASIAELFHNAMEHSETQYGVFACGQLFPTSKRVDFTVADAGVGMRERIRRDTGQSFSPPDAILWALKHTTRRRQAGKPGGLGLKLIQEFIRLNGGVIQIASDAGYWRFSRGTQETKSFSAPFPGTVVNIEINTADTQSYRLTSEIDPGDIF